MLCASCGTAEGDDIKLKNCTACYLVRYCGVKCQKDHRPKHKKECKKRAAELKDENLFKQPENNHLGDCPLCCVPLLIDVKESIFMTCCSKHICHGCDYANKRREIEGRLQHKCPFCRKATPTSQEESNEHLMKRIEANDPVAMCCKGAERYMRGHYTAAFDYWTKSAALGYVEAHQQLASLYTFGRGGAEKVEKKAFYHTEQAAIGGHPLARFNLGLLEVVNGQYGRAAKHFIIAANLGCDEALEQIKRLFKAGYANKEDYTAALRGYQAAIAATKSPQREEAAAFLTRKEGLGAHSESS